MGTTAEVCIETGCNWLGVELNQDYIDLAWRRIAGAQPPLFAPVGGDITAADTGVASAEIRQAGIFDD